MIDRSLNYPHEHTGVIRSDTGMGNTIIKYSKMNKYKAQRVFWHGIGSDKEDSLFNKGILCRYDRVSKKYLVIYKQNMNDFLVVKIHDDGLDEIVLKPSFKIRMFEAMIKMKIREWATLPFPEKLLYLLQFKKMKQIAMEVISEHTSAKEVCRITKIKFDNSLKFV